MANGGAQNVQNAMGPNSFLPGAPQTAANASNQPLGGVPSNPAIVPQPNPAPYSAQPVGGPVYDMRAPIPAAPNINQTAARGINQSIAGAGQEMAFSPEMIAATGYDASQVQGEGFAASPVNSQGYSSANTGSRGYDANQVQFSPQVYANQVQAGQIGNADLSSYMNQYDDGVIQNTLSDLDRARQIQQQGTGASATAAGAYGGSRHALRESEDNRNYFDQAAKTSSALRQAGYQNAQNLGLSDLQSQLQASLSNQGANLQANSLSANLAQARNMANQSATNLASQFGASADNQAMLTNAASQNRASEFGASAANSAAQQQAAQQQAAAQYAAQVRNEAALANQTAQNQANQYNATAMHNAMMANQAAQLQASQQRLNAGSQLGNLSNLGFDMGQTLTGNLAQDGAMKQGLNQLVIDAGKDQFNAYQQAPYESIGLLSQALGASPVPQTTTTEKQPGLFDYLTLGAGMMGGG